MVAFITAVAVTELSILIRLTSELIRYIVVSITFVLSVLAISEVIFNAILRRAHRVEILMAFGAKRWLIALSLLTESSIGSIIGSLIGSLTGLTIIFLLQLSTLDLAPNLSFITITFSIGFAVGVIACVHPILKITEPSISERY